MSPESYLDVATDFYRRDDGAGHLLLRDMPIPVCDKSADALAALGRTDIVVTGPTFHHRGGGCC